ncbi:hypothetical protein CRG98_023585, partial [Punica granatum]
TVLSMDGGSRLKGVNSLKSNEDLWGPVRWHSRLDPFPYSEPLTNLASYFGARGISDKWSRQAVCTRILSRRGTHARAYTTRLGSIHLPVGTRVRRSRHLLFTTRRSRAVKSPGSRGTGST